MPWGQFKDELLVNEVSECKKISVSFSGGRSSAAMCWLILNEPAFAGYEKQFLFANTGEEHPATLDFVNECDRRWNLNLVWLEAVFHKHGKAPTHKVVNYQTATRGAALFDAGCQKFGLPNVVWKWCTRDLKIAPMDSYRKATGFDSANIAIGIRADEIDRIRSNEKIVYPLIDFGWEKSTVNKFWESQGFDLKIPSDAYGNCVWCYKKSFRKLATVARYHPEFFETPKMLEKKYAHCGARRPGEEQKTRQIYRQNKTTEYIFSLANDAGLKEYQDLLQTNIFDEFVLENLDLGGDCDQGCEIY